MENKSNNNYNNLIFVLIGVVALVVSYLFGFNNLNASNDDLSSEIDTLQAKYDSLSAEYSKKDQYIKDTKAAEKDYEEMLKKFDAGVTEQSLIVDSEAYETKLGVTETALNISSILDPNGVTLDDGTVNFEGVYQFGQMQSLNPEESGVLTGADSSFKGINAAYDLTATGSYQQISDLLQTVSKSNKRKVPSSLNFTYDGTKELVTINMKVNEYAIVGNDRKMSDVDIKKSAEGQGNIFFSQLYSKVNAATE